MSSLSINERKVIDENVFKYEDRLSNQTSRFQDNTITYVTYHHIDDNTTTTDAGFQDVASIIGSRSPIRFNKITDFPMIIPQEIMLSIQDEEQGLDSNFEGEATIMPGTIRPCQNDFFVIPYLRDSYMFKVTSVEYDQIKTNNYYKISFILDTVDDERLEKLEDQTNKKFTCITTNIGTDRICILDDEINEKIDVVNEMYNDICDTYMTIFYDEGHNCFLGELGPGERLYDPMQTEFINKHSLFNKENDYKTFILTDQYNDRLRKIKYEKSIYRAVERRNKDLINNFPFVTFPGVNRPESSFSAYHVRNIMILDTPNMMDINRQINILSDETVMSIKTNGFTNNKYTELIQRYIRNEDISIDEIPLNLMDELLTLDANLEMFFFIPIILYIIKDLVSIVIKK